MAKLTRDRAMGAIFRTKYGVQGHLKMWGRGGFPGRPTCVSIDYGVSNDAKQQCPHN